MRRIFVLLSLAVCPLEASHFQSSISVKPINETQCLAEICLEKKEASEQVELIAAPKIVCTRGEPAGLTIASEDQSNLLKIEITVPKNNEEPVQASFFMKENDQVVLSLNQSIQL
jgi:hypothetical protein